jgi:serine phosphatase RsbU (regulator of sigma subunit)
VSALERRNGEVEPGAGDAAPVATRRAVAFVALAAVLLFAAVAGALAWRQFRDAQRDAADNSRARAVLAADNFDTYFTGQIGILSAIAQAPIVQRADEAGMLDYFSRVQPPGGKLFPGGLAWSNLRGIVRVSTNRPQVGDIADVTDRSYFRQVIRTGQPFVSEGLTGKLSGQQDVAIGYPTRDAAGKLTGVLVGSLPIKPADSGQATLDLGFAGLAILDRKNQSLLAGFEHPKHLAEPARFGKSANGVLSDTAGLNGEPGHVLAYARAKVPQWTVIIDRSRADIFAAAWRTFILEIATLGGVALLDLAILLWIFQRARAEAKVAGERALRRRRRYEQEHEVATTLQRSLLAAVPEIHGVDSAARYQAGSTGLEVGGDWFDVLRRPDGILQITVGDVAGRGVAAAALMGQLRNAFRAYAYEHASPAAVMTRLQRHIVQDEMATAICIAVDPYTREVAYAYEHASPAAVMTRLQRHIVQDEMATAICIAVDPYTREVAYASAGHPPPLLRDDDDGSITPLSGAQFSLLGPVAVKPVLDGRLALPRNATLIAYTDGMVERRDEVIDAGIDRLAAAFRDAGSELTAAELADRLLHEVAEVTAADDDIALLVLRFGDTPAVVEMDLPADLLALAEARRRVELWLAARGVGAARTAGAMLALREALSDALEHADPSTTSGIALRIAHEGDDVRIAVDGGNPRDV